MPSLNEEFFDVVNERDEPISRAPRSEVHRLGLLHRAVHILIFDDRGRVFLQKRSNLKDTSPGLWDSSSSGHLDSQETYDAAAVRELKEELGLTVAAPLKRWFRIEACPETGGEFCWVYRLRSNGPFVLDPTEIAGGEWIEPEEVSRRIAERPEIFCSAFKLIWERAKNAQVDVPV